MKTINYFKKCDNKENNESINKQRINVLVLKNERMKDKFAEKRKEAIIISREGRRETIYPVAKMALLR